ncbi:MAG: hypothetical protein IKA95_01830 [Clostridia bacterium]|nr:hypothetical protein [Clostridia bacterium]
MYTTFFANNKTYGADDINKVFAHLTTQGVSLFEDTGAPLMDLDTALANMVSTGVQVYDVSSCKVTALGNNKFKILKGCCWMPSGACVMFDDAGHTFEPNFATSAGDTSTTCYVYLKQGGDEFEGASNDVHVVASGDAPTDADLPLATVSTAGAVTDKRKVAVSKVAVPAENPVKTVSVSLNSSTPESDLPGADLISSTVLLETGNMAYGYICDSILTNGDRSGYYVPLIAKLSSSWSPVTIWDESYDRWWLYARKTTNGIEVYLRSNQTKSLSFNLMLFLGEPI